MKIHIQQRINQEKVSKQVEEEHDAALHFTLIDFAQMVQSYGANEVLSNMDEETFWHLYKWFGDTYGMDFRRGG